MKNEEVIKLFFSNKVKTYQVNKIFTLTKLPQTEDNVKLCNDVVMKMNMKLYKEYINKKPKNMALNQYLQKLSVKTVYDSIPIIMKNTKTHKFDRYNDDDLMNTSGQIGNNCSFISATGQQMNDVPDIDMSGRPQLKSETNDDVNARFEALQNSRLPNTGGVQQQMVYNSMNKQQPVYQQYAQQYNPQQPNINNMNPQNMQRGMNQLSPEEMRAIASNPEMVKNMFADKNYQPKSREVPQVAQQSPMMQQNMQPQQGQDSNKEMIDNIFSGMASADIFSSGDVGDYNSVYTNTMLSEQDKEKFNTKQDIEQSLKNMEQMRSNKSFFEVKQGDTTKPALQNKENVVDYYQEIIEQPTNLFNTLKDIFNITLKYKDENGLIQYIKDLSDEKTNKVYLRLIQNKKYLEDQIKPTTFQVIYNILNKDIIELDEEDDISDNYTETEEEPEEEVRQTIPQVQQKQRIQTQTTMQQQQIVKKEEPKIINIPIRMKDKEYEINLKNKKEIKSIKIEDIKYKAEEENITENNNSIEIKCNDNVYRYRYTPGQYENINDVVIEFTEKFDDYGMEIGEDNKITIENYNEDKFDIINTKDSIFRLLGFTKNEYKGEIKYTSENEYNIWSKLQMTLNNNIHYEYNITDNNKIEEKINKEISNIRFKTNTKDETFNLRIEV